MDGHGRCAVRLVEASEAKAKQVVSTAQGLGCVAFCIGTLCFSCIAWLRSHPTFI